MNSYKKVNMNVLFLCTGNSCRSQMAEAIVNQFAGDSWTAWSAGTDPAGYVHPKAIQVLEEIGIRHQGKSKDLASIQQQPFDLVITVCDEAAENCPLWLGSGKRIHLGFPDPAEAKGTEDQVLAVFRDTRDRIREVILARLEQLENGAAGPRNLESEMRIDE